MFQQFLAIANLGADPNMRYTPSGVPVTSFRAAVNRSWTDQEGVKHEKTLWFEISCWRKLAEIANQYLHRGSMVFILGEVEEPSVFTDRDGNNRASLKVTAKELRFLDRRNGAPNSANENGAINEGNPSADKATITDEDIPF